MAPFVAKGLSLAILLSLPTVRTSARCPSDCNGANGVCQDGVCLCADGFVPPDCSRSLACPNNVGRRCRCSEPFERAHPLDPN